MNGKVSEILARALLDAGVEVVTHVPGHGGTEVFAALCELSGQQRAISFHEEVAYSIAHGASLVGTRAATVIKAHGLVKAANSVMDSLFSGTTAGLLVLVFDDKHGRSSDCIFDVAAFLDGVDIPYHRATKGTAYQDVMDGFEASERLQLPYAVIVDAEEIDECATVMPMPVAATVRRYQRNVAQHFVGPLFVEYQRQVLSAKKSGADWTSIAQPALPVIPANLPNKWQSTVEQYMPLFAVLQTLRGKIVTGDTSTASLFALPPYGCVDLTTYMGGSVPLAIGASLAGYEPVWALTGDFSFVAAGQLGLPEAAQRGVPLKVLVFRNERADATGGQPIPGGLLDVILDGYRNHVRYIHDPRDAGEIRRVLDEASAASTLRIIVADYRTLRSPGVSALQPGRRNRPESPPSVIRKDHVLAAPSAYSYEPWVARSNCWS